MAITIKDLAETLAEIFGIDETEALTILLQKGIRKWEDFQKYIYEVKKQERIWKR